VESGIILTGGSALLEGLQEYLQNEIKLPVRLAPDPMLSVVVGADRIQNDPSLQNLLICYKK
jgi:rod shape-determining protein MreB